MQDEFVDAEVEPATALVRRDETFLPALTVGEAISRFNTLVHFVKTALRENVDYGKIPGTDKPTLLKPGAEKLCTLFGLATRFELKDAVEDWEKGFFYYRYCCSLWRGGQLVAEAEGSANSKEKKYRYRHVPEFKATATEKAAAVKREERMGKNGRPWTMLTIENDDPYTLVNTLQKMAQKRAFIGAALVGVNASEFFTQDVEDILVPGSAHAPALEPEHIKERASRAPELDPHSAEVIAAVERGPVGHDDAAEKRDKRARALAAAGHVVRTDDAFEVTTTGRQRKTYRVWRDRPDTPVRCSCPEYAEATDRRFRCEHILAVKYYLEPPAEDRPTEEEIVRQRPV